MEELRSKGCMGFIGGEVAEQRNRPPSRLLSAQVGLRWAHRFKSEGWAPHSRSEGWAPHSRSEGWAPYSRSEGWAPHSRSEGWEPHSRSEGWAPHSRSEGWALGSHCAHLPPLPLPPFPLPPLPLRPLPLPPFHRRASVHKHGEAHHCRRVRVSARRRPEASGVHRIHRGPQDS